MDQKDVKSVRRTRVVPANKRETVNKEQYQENREPNAGVVAAEKKRKYPTYVQPQARSTNIQKPVQRVSQNTNRLKLPTANTNKPTAENNFQRVVENLGSKLSTLQSQVLQLNQQLVIPEAICTNPQLITDFSLYSKEVNQAQEKLDQLLNEQIEVDARHRLEKDTLENRIIMLRTQLETTQASVQLALSEKASYLSKISQLTEDTECLQNEFRTSVVRLEEELQATINRFSADIQSTTDQLQSQLDIAVSEADAAQKIADEKRSEIEDLQNNIAQQKSRINYLEVKSRSDEALRKQLHESIQELKGNIRVICRVRPLLGNETMDDVTYLYPSNTQEIQIEVAGGKDVTGRRSETKQIYPFKFDRVFGPKTTQKEVFEEISHLVQSSLDGYNCCIFAYGQTGSGKTYTMEGGENLKDEETRGMISRAVQQIFEYCKRLKEQGWNYVMHASFLEIYNDAIRDLLSTNPNLKGKGLELKHDQKSGKTTVPDLTTFKVTSPAHVFDLLQRASTNRAKAETLMNHYSSRSHSIFQLQITGHNSITNESVEGLLNLIDLAGSEKLDQAGDSEATKKETIQINTSLTNLKNVITSIANNDKHVPYRNSKLTFLLQNSIGGSAKTMMFVNISPAAENLKESLNSLRFAANVNVCDIGTAKKSTKIKF